MEIIKSLYRVTASAVGPVVTIRSVKCLVRALPTYGIYAVTVPIPTPENPGRCAHSTVVISDIGKPGEDSSSSPKCPLVTGWVRTPDEVHALAVDAMQKLLAVMDKSIAARGLARDNAMALLGTLTKSTLFEGILTEGKVLD